MFQITRIMHVAGRCTDCGECERACPVNIPLRSLSKKMEELKDEFIGMVSHELKNPLTVIIGALNVAESEAAIPELVKELIHDAATSAEELSVILDNLLELSRHQSDRLNLQAKKSQIESVVQDVVNKLHNRSAIHRITADFPSGLPPVVIDPVRIERVLYNLVENAIKYSPKGGEVKIAIHQENNQMVTGVSDQGIGISPEGQKRLFQSFQRLDIQKKHNIPGVGLGLRVCRILVEAHGGKIWVESEMGNGSTFFFSVPIASR